MAVTVYVDVTGIEEEDAGLYARQRAQEAVLLMREWCAPNARH